MFPAPPAVSRATRPVLHSRARTDTQPLPAAPRGPVNDWQNIRLLCKGLKGRKMIKPGLRLLPRSKRLLQPLKMPLGQQNLGLWKCSSTAGWACFKPRRDVPRHRPAGQHVLSHPWCCEVSQEQLPDTPPSMFWWVKDGQGLPSVMVSAWDLHCFVLFYYAAVCFQSIASLSVVRILSEPVVVLSCLCSFIFRIL